ncbi:hypothetical protein [Ancylobacter oerskovii]|uniref:Uncharacterized protein n=1 Tax=Ancylobacter oerskovii TaxID=459519 RepID=A0ABW4Z3J6_9HYPH|nr:hypothetical protein [Ancylobacter oerskovii]MBS7545962.1 hypothetical protein [Ancylobacter oerskovii]
MSHDRPHRNFQGIPGDNTNTGTVRLVLLLLAFVAVVGGSFGYLPTH